MRFLRDAEDASSTGKTVGRSREDTSKRGERWLEPSPTMRMTRNEASLHAYRSTRSHTAQRKEAAC